MKVKRVRDKMAWMWGNIVRVLKLAWEIDAPLLVKYYLTSFVGAVSPILAALLFRAVIDQVVTAQNGFELGQETLPLVVVLSLAGYFFIRTVENVVYGGLNLAYYDYLLRNKVQSGLNYRYSAKLSSLDLGHLENPEVQNLITKVEHTFTWKIPDFVRIWNYIFRDMVGIVSVVIALTPIGLWIPAMVLVIALPRAYLKVKHGNFVWSMYGGGAPEAKKLWYMSGLLNQTSSIIETRLFQSRNALLGQMAEIQDHLFSVNKKPLDNYRWVLIFAPIVESCVVFFLVLFVLPDALSGIFTIGTLTFVISTLEQLVDHTTWGAAHLGELYEHSLFVDPYFELMNLPQLVKEKPNAVEFKQITPPEIEFKGVSFTYPGTKNRVLKEVSFRVKPGESVALVGINGAGKSTIIKLLCRFYDVDSGAILVNGVNLKELKLANWYQFLGTLFQDFVRYNFSVRDNIMLGKPEVRDEQRMKQAAKDAGADTFITTLTTGYDQMLGRRFEDGQELSSGQWQKLAIARAFYEQAPVLILDEPTSAIDAEAEFAIFENLKKVYQGKTLLLVSHRFSTVRNANKIIVIDNGRVLEMGNHAELVAKDGKYAKMFNTQAKGYQ